MSSALLFLKMFVNRIWMRHVTEHTTKEEFEAMKEDSDKMDREFQDKNPKVWELMVEGGLVTTSYEVQ